MPLYIVEKKFGPVTLLDLRGRITLGEETEALRSKLKELTGSGRLKVIVDLGGVHYVDSAGLGTLVAGFMTTKNAGGTVKLLRLTKMIGDLLQITRLSTVFESFESLEAALKSFPQE